MNIPKILVPLSVFEYVTSTTSKGGKAYVDVDSTRFRPGQFLRLARIPDAADPRSSESDPLIYDYEFALWNPIGQNTNFFRAATPREIAEFESSPAYEAVRATAIHDAKLTSKAYRLEAEVLLLRNENKRLHELVVDAMAEKYAKEGREAILATPRPIACEGPEAIEFVLSLTASVEDRTAANLSRKISELENELFSVREENDRLAKQTNEPMVPEANYLALVNERDRLATTVDDRTEEIRRLHDKLDAEDKRRIAEVATLNREVCEAKNRMRSAIEARDEVLAKLKPLTADS